MQIGRLAGALDQAAAKIADLQRTSQVDAEDRENNFINLLEEVSARRKEDMEKSKKLYCQVQSLSKALDEKEEENARLLSRLNKGNGRDAHVESHGKISSKLLVS